MMRTGRDLVKAWNTISTLDESIDAALAGGIPTGYITEIAGESGAGKTQFLLGLLLSVQLPAPHGLSRSALYISTESALPTTRLAQILAANSLIQSADPKPSLDKVISIMTPDLESQDHILRFQLPIAIQRHNIGLIVLDSIAANYRAEFDRPGASNNGANMAKRSADLVELGALLRSLARTENISIVVANQVGDRFTSVSSYNGNSSPIIHHAAQSSPLAHRSAAISAGLPPPSSRSTQHPPSSLPGAELDATHAYAGPSRAMTLDHQQRWFTGWGDDYDHFSAPSFRMLAQKTPSLGLVWTNQIACRIALIKTAVYGPGRETGEENELGEPTLEKWRRYVKIVFAPWCKPSGTGLEGAVEFQIVRAGISAVVDSEHDA